MPKIFYIFAQCLIEKSIIYYEVFFKKSIIYAVDYIKLNVM